MQRTPPPAPAHTHTHTPPTHTTLNQLIKQHYQQHQQQTTQSKGLIYRGEYMVNWSPKLGTAVSDLEVEYSEEPGFLYTFK